jgi:hypothetical protein
MGRVAGLVTQSGMGREPVGCRGSGRAAAIRKNVRRHAQDRLPLLTPLDLRLGLLPSPWPRLAGPWVRRRSSRGRNGLDAHHGGIATYPFNRFDRGRLPQLTCQR